MLLDGLTTDAEDEEAGDEDDEDDEPINPLVDALFDEIEALRLQVQHPSYATCVYHTHRL